VARAQSHWRLKVVATAAPATARLPIRELGGMAPRDTKGIPRDPQSIKGFKGESPSKIIQLDSDAADPSG